MDSSPGAWLPPRPSRRRAFTIATMGTTPKRWASPSTTSKWVVRPATFSRTQALLCSNSPGADSVSSVLFFSVLWHIVAKAQVRSSFFARAGIFGCTLAISLCAGCDRRLPTVAVIPRTTALILWEAAHAGAESAARQEGLKVYWNAPTREDDVQRQIDIMQHAISSGARGLVLAPDQGLALMVPVRNIVARGIPTVIISSRLPVQPGGKLSYILNDEETTGRLAAQRIGQILSGKGTVAVLGVDPDVSGILERTHAFEASLASLYPGVR